MFSGKNNYKEMYESAQLQLGAANDTISKLTAQVDEDINTIQDLNDKLNNIEIKHKAELDIEKIRFSEMENSVNAKVNNILASMGVTNFAVESISNSVSMSPKEALEKFITLNGAEKTEFYKNNKDLITQGLLLNKLTGKN